MSGLWGTLDQLFPPAPKWTADNIPDLSGKVTIVTGGNTGIGKETIRALLNHNAKVYLAARNEEKARNAIASLKAATGKEALFLRLDLANLESVRNAAEEFMSKEKYLHILFNNAGVMWPPVSMVTDDGYDLQFGTNVIGHFHFTQLLMPTIIATAESSVDKQSRIITTSSIASNWANELNYDFFIDGPARRACSRFTLYGQSKFGNIVVAKELARRYSDKGIISISLHPGSINTELKRHVPGVTMLDHLSPLFLYDAAHGALTQLYAGTTPEATEYNGKFLVPWARPGEPNPATQDPEVGKQLWDWLELQVDNH